MTKFRATFIGFGAILLWSLLALFTVGSAPTPPLMLNAICFGLGGGLGIIWVAKNSGLSVLRRVDWRVYVFGTVGLFGYHALYFSALRIAPAAQAGLIAYLWPLLIVLFSALLTNERLRRGHVWGAILAFAGAGVIILKSGTTGFQPSHLVGYALALACAVTWSGYSVLSRRLGDVPTAAVAVFCLATAVLSAALHMALETTIWPRSTIGWASVIGLGLGPVGLAFYVWDIGVKKGDIQILGTASYAAPLLSTLILVATGQAQPSWSLVGAAICIAGGAALAARASFINS
jgi:drug/metabolite transporter (DMT)-like permease